MQSPQEHLSSSVCCPSGCSIRTISVSLIAIVHDLERTESRGEHTVDHINLVPTPSHDPADPLNWPWWCKCVVLAFASLFAFVSNFTSASLASALPILDTLFYRPETFASLGHLIALSSTLLTLQLRITCYVAALTLIVDQRPHARRLEHLVGSTR
jgi:hypothetical protein